ncbi:Thiol:disulfide interchange protein DsbE [Burkholderiales bacterium]|nr:Thiol:disulfide interchange protein DsbE [Burkholderiales bacterium]
MAGLAGLAAFAPAARAARGPAARVGDRVVWRDVTLLDGTTLPASLLERGPPVVVELWATWCPFCKRQNPHLQALADRHRGTLTVLALAIDKDPDKARAYMKDHGYTFPAAMAGSDAERWFGKREGLPEIYVVDRGRIVFREIGEMFPEDVAALGRYAVRRTG